MTETQETTTDKYVKLPDPATGDVTEAKLRLLEWPGKQTIQHWIGPDANHLKPYNCPNAPTTPNGTWRSRNGCPACAARSAAKLRGEDYRALHRMNKKVYVNALDLSSDDPKLKILPMGASIVKAIETLTTRKGKEDPTTYDITLIKRKTGPEKFNVEYSVFFEEVRPLNAKEQTAAQTLFDLSVETKDAPNDLISSAIAGQRIEKYADEDTVRQVMPLLEKHKLTLEALDIADEKHIPISKAKEILSELS